MREWGYTKEERKEKKEESKKEGPYFFTSSFLFFLLYGLQYFPLLNRKLPRNNEVAVPWTRGRYLKGIRDYSRLAFEYVHRV